MKVNCPMSHRFNLEMNLLHKSVQFWAFMRGPGTPFSGTSGAGRFASGVAPEVPGAWNGLTRVVGGATDDIILKMQENQRIKANVHFSRSDLNQVPLP